MQRRFIGTEREQIKKPALLFRKPHLLRRGEWTLASAAPPAGLLLNSVCSSPLQTVSLVLWVSSFCAKILRPLKSSLQKKKKKKKETQTALVRLWASDPRDTSVSVLANRLLCCSPRCCAASRSWRRACRTCSARRWSTSGPRRSPWRPSNWPAWPWKETRRFVSASSKCL